MKGKQGEAEVRVDASIDNVKPEDFDALLIPGGFSPDILRADDRYVQFTKAFMDEKTSICDLSWTAIAYYSEDAGRKRRDRLYIHSSRYGKRRRHIQR